jgi:hypothetical protein
VNESRKDCFGRLDKVFPMAEQGLRQVPPDCFDCAGRKACMQAALETRDGIAFRGELLERSPQKGVLGRIKRWSRKKTLAERMKEEKKGRQ